MRLDIIKIVKEYLEVSEKPFLSADGRRLHTDYRGLSHRKNPRVSAFDPRESALKDIFQRSHLLSTQRYSNS